MEQHTKDAWITVAAIASLMAIVGSIAALRQIEYQKRLTEAFHQAGITDAERPRVEEALKWDKKCEDLPTERLIKACGEVKAAQERGFEPLPPAGPQ